MIGARRLPALAIAVVAMAFAGGTVRADGFYRLESAVTLPGPVSGWDYLTFEPARRYVFIGRRKEGVSVFDVAANQLVGQIENSTGANATTLVPEFDRGYTANEDGSTTIFTLSTLKTIARVKFGADADAGFYEPVTKQIVFTMGDSRKLAFADAKTGKVTGTIDMQSAKLEATVADGEGNIFTAERDRNAIVRVDARQRKVTAEWKTDGCGEPTGMAFDRPGHRLFIGCRGNNPVLAILDAISGKVIKTLEIGRGNDGVVYDAGTHRIFTANGIDANLVIFDQISPDAYSLREATTTRPQARTMALDSANGKIFLVAAEGYVDPAKTVNRSASPFYPNSYFAGTLTLVTYSQHQP